MQVAVRVKHQQALGGCAPPPPRSIPIWASTLRAFYRMRHPRGPGMSTSKTGELGQLNRGPVPSVSQSQLPLPPHLSTRILARTCTRNQQPLHRLTMVLPQIRRHENHEREHPQQDQQEIPQTWQREMFPQAPPAPCLSPLAGLFPPPVRPADIWRLNLAQPGKLPELP